MCGIAGQVRRGGQAVDPQLIDGISAAQEHRGPDSRGQYLAPGVGFGIQRLRIIDLKTGDQPIFSEDGQVAVVLNGEIYNFRELRRELEAQGHRFQTASDTEVIAHAYEEHGSGCVRRLHGMFALAIWDARRRRLTLARDRVGKKPLFYSVRGDTISFASELGALLADREIPRDLDPGALDAYFAYRYVPAPLCAFAAVRKLQPAHTLVFDDEGMSIDRYWSLDYSRNLDLSDDEAAGEIRSQLQRAVDRRLVSDVPLGAFLSGGIDSASVVAAMAHTSAQPVKTFSIGFEGELNELPLARAVAERFGTEHHELMVEPNAIEVIPQIVRHYGEPFADATAVPTFFLAQMARRHVTVALNGDGGDETFGGYTRYVSQLSAARLDRIPATIRALGSRAAHLIPPSGRIDSTRSRARRLGATLVLDPSARYFAYVTNLIGLTREALYTPEFQAQVTDSGVELFVEDIWQRSSATSLVDRMLDVDVSHYLPDDLLTKVDIATMACSLEGRSPFVDHELMEFAASLPARLKVKGAQKKVGLRLAMRGVVPDEVLDAPKRGFRPPLAQWFRGELEGFAREVLLDPRARERGYVRPDRVEQLLDRHSREEVDAARGIWTLLMFELWQREFVDAPAPEALVGGAA